MISANTIIIYSMAIALSGVVLTLAGCAIYWLIYWAWEGTKND